MSLPTVQSPLQRIADDLAEQGWSQQPLFLPYILTRELNAECRLRAAAGDLEPAAIGRGVGQQVREGVRGDRIQWVERGQSEVCDRYLETIEELRQVLNQTLFLGLEDFEGHFALYPPGAFYARHLDRFHDDDRRTVSTVFYLNEEWQPQDGGELRMHFEEGWHDVQPIGGTLMVFLSAGMLHEVLPATRERLSLTGWFRRRAILPL
jgi:SM-20-related protein